jgi:hypothetical protein
MSRYSKGLSLLILAGLALAGAKSKTTSESIPRGTNKLNLASTSFSGGTNKLTLAYQISLTNDVGSSTIPTASASEIVREYFSQPAKTFTNPEGSTINPLTGTNYIQPVELYPVTAEVSNNQAAVAAIDEYNRTGDYSAALTLAGDDVEARHALLLVWLGAYG